VTFLWAQPQNGPQQKIAPRLLSELPNNGSVTFFVVMKEHADTRAANGIQDWASRGHAVVDNLRRWQIAPRYRSCSFSLGFRALR
jgi:hypothetical protein